MRSFFDTSVLVPVFVPGHQHHERSLIAFSAANLRSGYCAAHSLAEVYASLTRLPGKYRAAPEQAVLCLETVQERLNVIAQDVAEYVAAIREAAGMGIEGGTLYDALLGACAIKAKADVLYTWNTRDFQRLGANVGRLVRTP
jgi:predicted nucleic acid-binding protein